MSVSNKKEEIWTQIGREPCEDEGKDQSDASEHQRFPANYQELRERDGTDSPS